MKLMRFMLWTLPCVLSFSSMSCSFNNTTGSLGGAAVGAGAGGGLAALFGASRPVIGLAALGGAGLGYYVTTLTFNAGGVTQSGGQVFTEGDFVTIEIPSDRLFDTNTSELLPGASPILNSAITVLNRYPSSNILVSGSTSGFGTSRWQTKLSEARAREISAYFWQHGIGGYREDELTTRKLIYVGYGNYFPIANDIHNDSIRSNSRIQITAYPPKCDLQLGKNAKVFSNIGDNGSLTHSNNASLTAANSFRGDLLPEVPPAQPEGLSELANPQTIATPQPGNYYKE